MVFGIVFEEFVVRLDNWQRSGLLHHILNIEVAIELPVYGDIVRLDDFPIRNTDMVHAPMHHVHLGLNWDLIAYRDDGYDELGW